MDDNCDGAIDESTASDAGTWHPDNDGDGYGDATTTTRACDAPTGSLADSQDCDDADEAISPDASESCNGTDDDCDGYADGRLAVPAYYSTIQDAIDASSDGETICVAAATYYEVVDFGGHSVTLEGAGSTTTTIDAGGAGRTLTINDATIQPTLRGFTLTGGESGFGAGLYVSADNPTLDDLLITENSCSTVTDCLGTGMYLVGEATLTDITIRDNEATPTAASTSYVYGVGAYVYNGAGSWTNVDILDNTADGSNAGDLAYLLGVGLCLTGADIEFEDIDVSGNLGTVASSVLTYAVGTGAGIIAASDTSSWVGLVVNENSFALSGVAYTAYGAGMYLSASTSTFLHLDVRENILDAGTAFASALYVDDGTTVDVTNAIFAGNSSIAIGEASGAIQLESALVTTFTNVDVVGNDVTGSSARGGGFYLNGSADPTLRNVSIASNTLAATGKQSGSGVYRYADTGVALSATYCNVYGNTTDEVDGVEYRVSSDGNLAVDPEYTDLTGRSATDWDLALGGSALVDAGDPSLVDADGSRSDVGGYGGPGGSGW